MPQRSINCNVFVLISAFMALFLKGREENKNKYFYSQLFLFSDFPFWRVGSVCKTKKYKNVCLILNARPQTITFSMKVIIPLTKQPISYISL